MQSSTSVTSGVTRQETVHEDAVSTHISSTVGVGVERGTTLSMHRMDSYDCGLRDPAAIALYSSGNEYKEIMSNLMDFKVDVKLEIQRLNQRMGRMEELLAELVARAHSPPLSSGGSSAAKALKRRSKAAGARSTPPASPPEEQAVAAALEVASSSSSSSAAAQTPSIRRTTKEFL